MPEARTTLPGKLSPPDDSHIEESKAPVEASEGPHITRWPGTSYRAQTGLESEVSCLYHPSIDFTGRSHQALEFPCLVW